MGGTKTQGLVQRYSGLQSDERRLDDSLLRSLYIVPPSPRAPFSRVVELYQYDPLRILKPVFAHAEQRPRL